MWPKVYDKLVPRLEQSQNSVIWRLALQNFSSTFFTCLNAQSSSKTENVTIRLKS